MPQTNMQLREKITECLRTNPEKKFTRQQIAEWVWETYPDECQQKMANTGIKTEKDLIKRLSGEISSAYRSVVAGEPRIQFTGDNPIEWYFSEKVEGKKETPIAKSKADEHTTQPALTEHDLYPLLWEYLKTELSVYSKRIDERKAKNTRGARGQSLAISRPCRVGGVEPRLGFHHHKLRQRTGR